MASNPVTEHCNKHVDICHKGINKFIRDKKIELFNIEGSENPADMFTKSLGHILFTKFRSQLRLYSMIPLRLLKAPSDALVPHIGCSARGSVEWTT